MAYVIVINDDDLFLCKYGNFYLNFNTIIIIIIIKINKTNMDVLFVCVFI